MKITGCQDRLVPEQKCMKLREDIKSLELQAEHLQEDILEALASSMPVKDLQVTEQLSAVVSNIGRYFSELQITMKEDVNNHLVLILTATFPQANQDDIKLSMTS